MDPARAQQNIRAIEICHYMLNRNLAVLRDSLISKSDAHVYGCGDVDTQRLQTALLIARILECWMTDADACTELSPLFTQISALLGQKTERKTSLMSCRSEHGDLPPVWKRVIFKENVPLCPFHLFPTGHRASLDTCGSPPRGRQQPHFQTGRNAALSHRRPQQQRAAAHI